MTRKDAPRERITICGLVTPVEWDFDDEVTEVALCCEDGDEYIVSERRLIRKLMRFVDQELEVTGITSVNEFGEKALQVEDFSPVEDDEEEDIDEDEDLEEVDDDGLFEEDDDDEEDDDEDW